MERTQNPRYAGAPCFMSDGRILTDYRPSLYVDSMIMQANGLSTSNEYRKFLTNNALSLIKTNDVYVERKMEQICNQDAKPSQDMHRVCTFNQTGGMTCLVRNPQGLGTYIDTREPASPEQKVEGYCAKMGSFGPAY